MYINNLGHMTKMAAMPIYGKNPSKLEFVFYVKTDVSPLLRACPKYASKSYSSCTSHILSVCFISVPSFIEISLTVFKL